MPDTDLPGEIQAELAELRTYRERMETAKSQEFEQRKTQAFRSIRENALAFCDAQVRGGKLTPHLRQSLAREIEAQAHSFSEGSALQVSFAWVKRFIAESPLRLPQGEVGFSRTDAEGADHGDQNPSQTLARIATNRMKELNLTYPDAAEYVLRTQPALAQAYREFTLNSNS